MEDTAKGAFTDKLEYLKVTRLEGAFIFCLLIRNLNSQCAGDVMGVICGFELVPGIDGVVVDKCGCKFDGAKVTVNAVAFAIIDVELEDGVFRSDIAVPLAGGMTG